ncbi:tape measure domain-containing protein [Acidovorax sp. 107]|nr:tape measure domain-containing protein [Acidovorax sp. 107]
MTQEIESIGLGMDTSGVERGIKALDVLAGKGAPVEKAMAGIEGAADRTGKSLKSLGEGAAKGIDDLAKRAPAAASGLKKVDESADSAAKSVKSLGGAGSSGLDALNKSASVAATGMRSLSSAANEVTAAIRAEAAALTGLQSGVAALNAANAAAAKSAQELAISLQAASEQGAKVKKATGASAEAFVGLGGAAKYAGAALAAIGIGTTVSDLVKMADASTNVASRLSLVTTSASELAQVQRRLFDIAQSSRVSFVDLAGTYAQIARSTKELGVSQSSLLGIIKTVSQAVTISGGSAQSAQAALVQLSQGFAAGALRGEELNSVMEQTPRLAQAIADGLGVGIGKLREMGQAGELTAEKVLGALEKSAAKVEAEFGKMAVTVEQASTQAANSVLRLVGAFDKLSGATSFISGFITKLSQGIDFLSKDVEKLGSQGPLRSAAREVINLDAAAQRLRTGMQSGVLGPNAQAELDRINVRLEEAKRRFNELNAATGGTNPRDQTGFPTRTQSYAAEANRLAAVQAAMGKVVNGLSGVKDDFYKDLNSLYAGYKNGLIGLTDYQKQVAKLIKDSGTAKPDAGANAALNDSLAAQLQAYKNNDKAILDSRKAFYDAQALLVKLGGKSELDAIDESMAKEEEVWAQRKANFEAELAQAAKKKTSQAEVARITGQMQDAERDYEQNIAKLRAESALADAKSLDALEARVAGQEKASRAAMEQVRMAELEGKAIGLTGDALRVFNQQQLESSIPLALKMQAAWADQAGALGDLGRAARDQIQAMRDLAKAQGENRAAQMVYEYAKGIDDSNKLLQAEIGLMGMSEQARTTALEQLRIQLDLEQKIAFVKANVADTDKQAADIAKLQASASIAKANAANKAFLDEWKTSVGKYDDIFRQGFADMLNNGKDGWKSFTRSLVTTFKTTVADQIYKMFAQPFVVNIVGNLLGLVGGGAAQAVAGAASGGSALGTIGNAASGLSALTGTFGMGLRAGLSGLFGEAGLAGTISAGTTAIGAGNIAGGLGTLAGPLALVGGGLLVLNSLLKSTKGETRTGGQFGVSFDGTVTNQRRDQVYTYQGQQFDRDFSNGQRNALIAGQAYRLEGDPVQNEQAIRDAVSGTASGINAFLKALGSKATLTGFSAGLETSSKGRGGVFAGGILSDGTTFGESGKGDNYAGTLYEKFSTNSPDFKTALENFTLDLKQSTIQALQSVTDIPQTVQKMLKGVDAEALSEEAANALLESINAQIVGVQNLTTSFEAMGLDKLAKMGFDAAAGLAAAAGGFDKLQGNLNTFYDNFYSEEERKANLQKQVDKQFAELGIDVPKNREEFRKLVEDTLSQVEVQDKAKASLSKQINDALAAGNGKLSLSDMGGRSIIAGIDPALLGNGAADPAVAGKLNGFLSGITDLSKQGLDPDAFNKGVEGLINMNAEVLGIGKDASKTAATLLGLSGVFAGLNESAEEAAARIAKDQADARDKALRGLERAIAKEKEALQSQIDVAQEVASTMSGLFDLLKSNVRELYGEVDSTRSMLAAQGNDFITQALANARTTGYLPDETQLADAISAARNGLDASGYASQFEFDRDRLVLAGKLSELEGLTGKQLTSAERTVKELEAQSEQLDKTLDYWKQQIDIANGTYEATVSVADAVKHLESLMFPEVGKLKPEQVGGQASSGGDIFVVGGGAARPATTGPSAYLDYEKGVRVYADGSKETISPEMLAFYKEQDPEWWRKLAAGTGNVPSYDVGTNYVPRDMLAQIHEGEAIVPKAYNPAANPGMGGGNGQMEALLAALLEQNARLETRLAAIEGHTQDTSRATNGNPVSPVPMALVEDETV